MDTEEYIILNTASFARDFEFFSVKEPDFSTLKKRYGANLDVQKLIIEIADGRFSMFLSKIPGTRTDEKGRQMFYNIVAKGRVGGYEIATAARNIAAAAINDIQLLGEKFDKNFKTVDLRQYDDCRHTSQTQKDIQNKLLALAKNGLPECYSSKYEIDEDKIKILVTNPKDDDDEEPVVEEKKRMINALTLITEYPHNVNITKGTLVFMMTDTLYDSTIKNFDELVPSPHFGYILANENKSGVKSIPSKKKTNSQTPMETSPKASKRGLTKQMLIVICLLIISLIANVTLLIWSHSAIKSEQQDKEWAERSLDSLRADGQRLKESLKETKTKLTESSQPIKYFDEANHNTVIFNDDEFRSKGWFKAFIVHQEGDTLPLLVNDTIIVRSNVDFVNGICYVNIHKTSCQTPPFIQVPFSLIGENHRQELTQGKNKKKAAKTTNR